MRKIIGAIAGLILLASAGSSIVLATKTKPNADHKVTICHRTGSPDDGNQHNGYSVITVDIASSGYVKGGHTGHEQTGNGPGGDIIPAYDAYAKDGKQWVNFHYAGKNLSGGGAEFLKNSCNAPGVTPVPTPTPTPTATPAPTATPTATPKPSVTPTPLSTPATTPSNLSTPPSIPNTAMGE